VPFTLVHPAAVLPLARSPLVPSALVAGAMAPDLTYYLPLTWIDGDLNLTLTHTWTSVVWVDPLIGLALLGVFNLLVRRPLLALLTPAAAGRVLPVAGGLRWGRATVLAWIVVSLVLGSVTHLAWDGLGDAFGYRWSTALDLLGDIGGGVVLAWWLERWWRRTPPRPVPAGVLLPARARARVLAAVVLLTAAWVLGHGVVAALDLVAEMRQSGGIGRGDVPQYVARQAAVDGATALAVAVGAYAVGWHLLRAARRPGSAGHRGPAAP